jgi:hypothetical protein
MKYLLLFMVTLLFNTCKKENTQTITNQKPVLIKIEAKHIDGDVVSSPIILVR